MELLTLNISGLEIETYPEHYMIYRDGKFIESCDRGELNDTISALGGTR